MKTVSVSTQPKNKFNKRVHDLKTQNEDIRKFIKHSEAFVETKNNPVISKLFQESISLAVTQVNGCKLCSWQHSKNALKVGMSKDDIDMLLSGVFNNVPENQLEALLFAQHYAETKGYPDLATVKKINEIYSEEEVKDIMSNIFIIMLSNLHGNTMEAFKLRIKGQGVEGSSFFQELAVIINFFRIMPVILRKKIEYVLLNKKQDRLKRKKNG